MGKQTFGSVVGLVALLLATSVARAETSPVSGSTGKSAEDEAVWSRHVVDAYQQLQEQQQATQRSIENARQETEAAAKRNAEMLEAKLKQLEDAVMAQRQREVEALQSSHRFTLIIVGLIAGIGLFGMLFVGVFLLRSMNRRLTAIPFQPAGAPPVALGTGDTQLVTVDPTQQASQRFLSTIERLEKRVDELETTAHDTEPVEAGEPKVLATEPTGSESPAPPTNSDVAARVALLMGKGHTLLNLQQADRAIECFDEVIALDGTNGEAFVRKGAALEKLGRLDEAIDCYDRAIAVDTSMTMAYLCKGGVFNRLERYGEALQCYEQALRAQRKVNVS